MRSRKRMLFTTLLILTTIFAGSGLFKAPTTFASTAALQEGVNISPTSSTDFGSTAFDQSLKNLATTGANYVTLNIPLYQTNINTTDVQTSWNTPTAASLASALQYAHSLGLRVMLKFDVFPGDGQWAAYINPSDRDGWFSAYQSALTPFINIAQANNVEEICIGTEVIDMSTDTSNTTNAAHWFSLISNIRGMYSGKLTYGANWGEGTGFVDEKDHISFWSALDYLGIEAYFNLSGDGSVTSLKSSWNSWDMNNIRPFQQKWGKPILFTEVGYKSTSNSYMNPWMWSDNGAPDKAQQANDYQALFEYWDQAQSFAGLQLWFWSSDPSAGGPSNNDYTPQNKTAQNIMQQYWGGDTSFLGQSPVFTASANSTPSSPTVGQSTAFAVGVTNSGAAVSGTNVDMEIYNAAGTQVYQQIFSNQDFSAGASQKYNVTWTPTSAGAYSFDVGVFSGDWHQEYYWKNNVTTFSAGNTGGGTGSGGGSSGGNNITTSIDVWWPTNGGAINGVQPFKAMLKNMDVGNYSMFWQVDGGQLNTMPSNNQDYPHKEASVDVSQWSWRGTGPYVVTFVAKDQTGQVIAQTPIQIFN